MTSTTRSIGLLGASVAMIGFVVGASIFILPGALGATTGPAVVLSYVIAGFLALFSCGVAAQLGCAFPINGGSVVIIGSLVGPVAAFIVAWQILGGVVISIALMAIGFADYVCFIWPSLDRTVVAIGLIVALGVVNLLSIRSTLIGQGVLVAISKVVIFAFCAVGVLKMDFHNLVPFAPNGLAPVFAAVVPAFFSFSGFLVLLELGGEIKNPARNIPAAIAISFVVVLIIYCLVSLVIVGNIPWTELSGISAPASEVARRVMPAGAALGIAIAAATGAASTVNVLLLSYSRDIMMLGRLRALPSAVAHVSSSSGAPVYCIALLCGLSVIVVLASGTLVQYASVAVVGILAVQIILATAMLRLRTKRPDIYDASPLKLSPAASWIFGLGLAGLSLMLILVSVWDTPTIALAALGYASIGGLLYLARRLMFRAVGFAFDDRIRAELDSLLRSSRG